jgi:hypothetical protein
MEQNVPLGPVDSPHVVRSHEPRSLRPPVLPRLPVLLALAGLALAAAGVWLSVTPPQIEVSETPAAYTVDGVRLSGQGPGTYAGPAGAVVVRDEGATIRAAASTTLNGHPMTGHCAWGRGAPWESCLFTLGGRTVTATDTRTPSGWHRRYDDGHQIDILVKSDHTVLVPFPIGLV